MYEAKLRQIVLVMRNQNLGNGNTLNNIYFKCFIMEKSTIRDLELHQSKKAALLFLSKIIVIIMML